MLLQGKNIVITGSRRGIGRAIVEECAKNGANIWACARNSSDSFCTDMAILAEKYDVWIKPVFFDITNDAAMKTACGSIISEKKPVNALVNNAAIVHYDAFQLLPAENLRKIFENNYIAPLLMTQLFTRAISRSGGGSILFLSSVSGMNSEFGSTAYGGSKAAISHAVGVLARELAPQHIRVNALAPGLVNTEMKAAANEAVWQRIVDRTFLKRMAEPEEIAYIAAFLISEKASYINGQTIRADGGM